MKSPILIRSFPRAIIHIDGDAFFASCEQARRPELKGKPVICGKERGIAASMSYEAKNRGVTRAMRMFEIKKICPDAVVLPSDYETYSLLSKRFYSIVRRYTSEVEEYGVDECFADITGMQKPFRMNYVKISEHLQEALRKELGFTFSIGLAPNKVLAKVGSKWKKPYGLTVIPGREIHNYLEKLPVEKIWGIGPRTSAFLEKCGKKTALEFASAPEFWVKKTFSKPFYEIWQELNGGFVLPLNQEEKTDYASVQKVKTFTPPSNDPEFVFAQLSKNIENACTKLRRHKLSASMAVFFLRTQDFRDFGIEVEFNNPTNLPPQILPKVREVFDKALFVPGRLYRSTGVTMFKTSPDVIQRDLFSSSVKIEKFKKIYSGADEVAKKYGKHTLFLGTSWRAHQFGAHLTERGDDPERKKILLKGETKRKRLNIPMLMGDVI